MATLTVLESTIAEVLGLAMGKKTAILEKALDGSLKLAAEEDPNEAE